MDGRSIGSGFCAQVELSRRRILYPIVTEQLLEVTHATFEVVHVRAGYLSLGNGIEANAFDARFLTRDARRESLVAAIFPQPAPIAGRDIAKGGAVAGNLWYRCGGGMREEGGGRALVGREFLGRQANALVACRRRRSRSHGCLRCGRGRGSYNGISEKNDVLRIILKKKEATKMSGRVVGVGKYLE